MAGVSAPIREPILDKRTGRLTPVWERYFMLTLSPAVNTIINGNLETIPIGFEDGSIPFVEDGFLVEDNSNLTWDNINDVLNILAVKILGLTPDSVLYIDDDNLVSEDTPSFTWDNVNKVLSALKILTDKISFNLTAGLTPDEGELSWNDDDGTLNLGMPGGNVILQIGLESLARVVNKSGSTIPNGKLVYVSGSQGNRDVIALSDKTDVDTIFILGMATEDIEDNMNGYVARFGYVRGSEDEPIDTSGTVAGDPVYLGTAGDFTVTHPTNPTEAVVVIGNVNRVHVTEGVISLQPVKSFTIGNDFNGTMRQSVINKSNGVSSAAGFTAVNDLGHFTTVGIAGSNNSVFTGEVSIFYAPGYGDHLQAIDGNKDFVWFTDPTDSHDNSSLLNEVMRLLADGTLLFTDAGGLSGGSMYNHDTPTIVTISATDTPIRIPSGFVQGRSKNATFQNAREFVVSKAGYYDIDWSISFTTVSANQEIEGFVMVNNAINIQATAHRRISTATDTGAMGGTCSILLAVNDVIALGVLNETSTSNIIIEHANMKLTQVSGVS